MAKQDSKPVKPAKLTDPLLMRQVTSVQQRFVMPADMPAVPKFERPKAHGWYSIVFPSIHDENTVLELWMDEVYEWLKMRGVKAYFSCFAHGTEKKEWNRISPVFFFKDELAAVSCMWRFKGEQA